MESNTIKELIIKHKMTTKEFADYFGISVRTVESWRAGRYNTQEWLVDLLSFALENNYKKKNLG